MHISSIYYRKVADFAQRLNYPNFTKDFEDAFKGFPFASSKTILEAEFGAQNVKLYQELKAVMQLQGVQVRMPFVMTINLALIDIYFYAA